MSRKKKSPALPAEPFWGLFGGPAAARTRGVNTRPADYSRDEIRDMSADPGAHEQALRAVSAALAGSTKTYDLILQTYQDILTYDWAILPRCEGTPVDPERLRRDCAFAARLVRQLNPPVLGHEIVGLCMQYGKVFYTPRVQADAATGRIDYAFLQQLPEDWCRIAGRNSGPGKYTVAFNLLYFLQPGTDPADYGELFTPYLQHFAPALQGELSPEEAFRRLPDPEQLPGRPKLERGGTGRGWWVTLPAEKAAVFEVSDRSSDVVPPMTGLMAGLTQLPAYETVQMEQMLNPLTAVMTGTLETASRESLTASDPVVISPAARRLFENLWYRMLERNNTSGIGLFLAPAKDLKLQSLSDSKSSAGIVTTAVSDQILKAGLSSLIPTTSDPKVTLAQQSAKLAARYGEGIYRRLELVLDGIFRSLGMCPQVHAVLFGDIFSREARLQQAKEGMLRGDAVETLMYRAMQGMTCEDAKLCEVLTDNPSVSCADSSLYRPPKSLA